MWDRRRNWSVGDSPWRNPYKIGRDFDRAGTIKAYRHYLSQNLHLVARLSELRDQPLACWCRHDGQSPTDATACHGDVLLDLLNRYTDDELRRVKPQDVA